jgi:hypothetical protein
MHQQVRTTTTKSGSGSPGPGAMADEGGIADILHILVDAGVNLQSAGGRDLDHDPRAHLLRGRRARGAARLHRAHRANRRPGL